MAEHPKVTESTTVFKGKVFDVRIDTLRDGDRTFRQDIVVHRGSFAIIAEPSPGRIVLVRQYRHAAGHDLWEVPAGKAEQGEGAEAGARRELEEETGYRAGRMEHLYSVYPTPGFCDELLHVFHATGLQAGEQSLDEDETIEVRQFGVDEALALLTSERTADMKTLLALSWLRSGRYQHSH